MKPFFFIVFFWVVTATASACNFIANAPLPGRQNSHHRYLILQLLSRVPESHANLLLQELADYGNAVKERTLWKSLGRLEEVGWIRRKSNYRSTYSLTPEGEKARLACRDFFSQFSPLASDDTAPDQAPIPEGRDYSYQSYLILELLLPQTVQKMDDLLISLATYDAAIGKATLSAILARMSELGWVQSFRGDRVKDGAAPKLFYITEAGIKARIVTRRFYLQFAR